MMKLYMVQDHDSNVIGIYDSEDIADKERITPDTYITEVELNETIVPICANLVGTGELVNGEVKFERVSKYFKHMKIFTQNISISRKSKKRPIFYISIHIPISDIPEGYDHMEYLDKLVKPAVRFMLSAGYKESLIAGDDIKNLLKEC